MIDVLIDVLEWIVKFLGIVKNVILVIFGVLLIIYMFFGAFLQESYRLNPPSEAERAEDPWLIRFLVGE